MAITSYSQAYHDGIVAVTVTSDLSGLIYYHWYRDGAYVATTTAGSMEFRLEAGDQARIEVFDTNDPDYDPAANTPDEYPARRTLWWLRSLGTDVDYYRVEEKKGAGAWTAIGIVPHDDAQWVYSLLSPRLDDLADAEFRVVPVDKAGNDGTALALSAERIVRTPDAPDFTATFDSGTTKITFAAG